MLKERLNTLKSKDIYSLMFFALYKIREVPEYSSLSELVYVLDKDAMLNLCEIFGGQTITIPTVYELESLVYALLLYQYVKIDRMELEDALKLIKQEYSDINTVKKTYKALCEILNSYSFSSSMKDHI